MSFHSLNIRRAAAVAASGLLLAGMALPANAKDVESRPAKADASAAQAPEAAAAKKKYCMVDSLTGSRMPRKVCKTERQWANEGVDLSRN